MWSGSIVSLLQLVKHFSAFHWKEAQVQSPYWVTQQLWQTAGGMEAVVGIMELARFSHNT